MPEWTPPVTQYHCLISSCPWTAEYPGPDFAGDGTSERVLPGELPGRIAGLVNAVLRAHLETHPLEQWVGELGRLRELTGPAPDLTADFEWLLAAGLDVRVAPCGGAGRCCGDTAGRFSVRAAKPDPAADLTLPGGIESHGHTSPGEALAFAHEWCEQNGITP
jgi:hypothetical protein